MKKKLLFLVRGLPGSGKSTVGKLIENSNHYETDAFFIKDGEYKFDPNQLQEAHKWCKDQVEQDMKDHEELRGEFADKVENYITVSNTFTQEWEMKPYYELAQKYGYDVISLIVENRHNGVNIHNVPQETMEKMKKRFEIKL